MSSMEPGDSFISEDDLKALLDQWNAPNPSKELDQRVANSYYREFGSADAAANSVLLPQSQKEVRAMKFCSTCKEEFADKFSFCPVDGTPLTVPVVEPEQKIASAPAITNHAATPAFAGAAAGGTLPRAEFHLTMIDDAGLLGRLAKEISDVSHEYRLTWPEFKRDPFGFTKRTIVGYGQMASKFFANRYVVIGLLVALLTMLGLVGIIRLLADTQSNNAVLGMVAAFSVFLLLIGGGVLFSAWQKRVEQQQQQAAEQDVVEQFIDIPNEQPTPDVGTAGLNKGNGGGSKPKQDKPGGGGGGGREEQKPASFGKTPQVSLTVPQVVAPDPHPPTIKNPALPVAATLVVDPMLVPPDARNLPYGDFKSKSTDPSSGPGTGNGIGTGRGGGIGSGEGGGIGPGRGGNIGGGDYHEGGGGPGGGGGGTDYNKIFSGKDVNTKARVLAKPEPQYTEEARKNQITGTVVLRAVFTSGGQVTNISARSGLPYGLTERAIAAARQIKFVPATKDGHAVSMYIQLEYNFNLY